MHLLNKRTAVVTGAARGLGLAIAEKLLAEGADVAISDIDEGALSAASESLGNPDRVVAIAADVTDEEAMTALLRQAADRFGGVDIMVNNAGFTRDATMRKMPVEDFDAVVSVHLKGCWIGTRAAADLMREQGRGGSIVNISSISGKVGNPGQTNYSAAKAGIVGLTKAAAKEVGFAGIRVNAVQPGLIESAMTANMPPDVLAARLGDIPLGRFGSPEEVAGPVAFLASDLASYITGTIVEIGGGRHA